MRLLRFLLCLSVLFGASARAEDWPQWRGPAGNGVSSERGLPIQWSTKEHVAWRAKLPGAGVSSPVVAGDRVFVTSQRGRGLRRSGTHPTLVEGGDPADTGERILDAQGDGHVVFVVSAYRASDGRELWTHDLPAEGDLPAVHDKHNLATPSPVTDGQMVFAWFGTGQVVALDVDGTRRWTRHLGTTSPFAINWGHSSSPTLYDDLLLLLCYHQPASYLLALDKRTGEQRWKVDRGRGIHSYSTPTIVRGERGPELIVNSSEGLESYDPRTGEALWRTPGENRFPIPVPAHHDGTLYTSRGYRSSPYLAVRLGGRGDISDTHVRWKVATGAPYISSLVHYDGLLYMATEMGIVTAIDAATGERVWRERLGGIYTASPVAADGRIYLVSETGETIVLKAGRTPEVLARNQLDDHLVASPAISGGRIYLRGDTHLIAIGR